MPIASAIFEDSPLPRLDDVSGISVTGVDPSSTLEQDAAAADQIRRDNDRRELRSAIRSITPVRPPALTSFSNYTSVANTPRFSRPEFYPGEDVGAPVLPLSGPNPYATPEDPNSPSLFPTGEESPAPPLPGEEYSPTDAGPYRGLPLLPPLDSSPPESAPNTGESDGSSNPQEPTGTPDGEPPLPDTPNPEEPVAGKTAMNDIYRNFNPGRLYRIFRV